MFYIIIVVGVRYRRSSFCSVAIFVTLVLFVVDWDRTDFILSEQTVYAGGTKDGVSKFRIVYLDCF